jgi:hemoglobin
MRPVRWWAAVPLTAVLAWAGVAAGAQEGKTGPLERKALDGMLYTTLRDVINHGADLYNSGDWAACYRLYEGALMVARPLLDHRPGLQKAIDEARASAESNPEVSRRAFVLRGALDQIRAEVNPKPPARKPPQEKPPVARKPQPPPDDKQPPVAQKPIPQEKPPVAKRPPKDDRPPDISPPPPPKGTLWERLGGEKGVKEIVHDIVVAVGSDLKVNFDRSGKYKLDAAGVQRLEKELVDQVSSLTGGAQHYDGLDMRDAHKNMGITDAQFDAFMGHVRTVLEKHKVDPADRKTILAAYESFRKDIVEPARKSSGKEPPR